MNVMRVVGLTQLVVVSSSKEAETLISVQADWADEVNRLPLGHFFSELVSEVALAGIEERVSPLFPFELVFSLHLQAQRSQCFAQLNIHDVRCCQIRRKHVDQFRRLGIICRFAGIEQRLDASNCRSCFAGKPNCSGGKSKHFIDRSEIHFATTQPLRGESQNYPALSAARKPPGVVLTFTFVGGTGAGSTAQETPNLTFSKKA